MSEPRKRALLWGLIGLSIIPTFLIVPFPNYVAPLRVALWTASSLGYTGIVLLLWLYILGTRSVMGLLFYDLAPVLKIHKKLGKYGPLAIFLHPLLLLFSYGLPLLLPNTLTQFDRHVLLGQLALYLVALTWGVSWFLKKRMAFRPWKYLHYLAYLALPFALLHVPEVGSFYSSLTRVKAYYFGLVVVFVVFSVFRLRSLLNLDKITYTVVSHRALSDSDYVLELKPLTARRIVPRRGQYVYLKLGMISEDHPFSVLAFDDGSGTLTLGYRIFGSYTNVMSRLRLNTRVFVSGPYGSFMADIDQTDRPLVYLAGGIGITPFVDQIRHFAGNREQWLFAANRSRDSAVLVSEARDVLGDHVVEVLSVAPPDPRVGEETGYVTVELLKKYLGDDLSRYSFYLCGPTAMMSALYALMDDAGISKKQVQSEKFGW